METRVVPTHPQAQWCVLLQRRAGDRYTLDASRKHRGISGQAHQRGSVTTGELRCSISARC